ncbi:hypothetical protein MIND_00444700 [Mycena indigotica]|uniref:Uncharacterized protein n=1 Tax=Mycena indigotica TaxID=2126181 RepID=A0A8H6WBN9_9AGAR|nr:uncharacterized protein MIND_00444700 [Mycena indigotica]KAF7306534.1 hypothetical protein MIND_00444700 [Mycena indigotica]
MSIPALVGGFELRQYDLPGAITFAGAYGLVVPVLVYRAVVANSRTAMIFEIIPFAIERCVVFCLRTVAAAKPGWQSAGLSEYFQVTLALEFIALAQILSGMIRTVLVNSTNPPPEDEPEPTKLTGSPLVQDQSSEWIVPPTNDSDVQRRRNYRSVAGLQFLLFYLPALILAIVSTRSLYANDQVSKNNLMQRMRYASTALGAVLLIWEVHSLAMAWRRIQNIDRRAVKYLLLLTALLFLPAIYRLCVMWHTTADIAAPTHAALNTRADKVMFYLFHVLPEWLVVTLLSLVNAKQVCNLGLRGDHRSKDETPEQREKRWAKVRAKKAKREQKKQEKAARRNGGGQIELSPTASFKSKPYSV